MHAAKADQYLAQTATLLRRRQAKIGRLDGNLVEHDIAARREEALIGYEFAERVDCIEPALKAIRSNLNVDQWCRQNCGVDIRTAPCDDGSGSTAIGRNTRPNVVS
jgi:hypothetical protein